MHAMLRQLEQPNNSASFTHTQVEVTDVTSG